MEFMDVIAGRFSCKKFDGEKKVEPEKLRAVLEAGRLAMTAKNLQEQKIYVALSPQSLAKIDEATPCRYGAPVVLVVAYDGENVFTYPGGKYDSGAEDASIVATHMALAAYDQGIDGCWVNNFDPDRLALSLGLPPQEKILMLLDLGHAADGAGPLPNHERRKPLSETAAVI